MWTRRQGDMKIYKTGEFAKLVGVSIKTLQRWDKSGWLVTKRTPSNMRFYTEEQYEEFLKGKNGVGGE